MLQSHVRRRRKTKISCLINPEKKKVNAARYYRKHAETIKEKVRRYAAENRGKIKARAARHYREHAESIGAKTRRYAVQNPVWVRDYARKWHRDRYHKDPVFRLTALLRTRVWCALNSLGKSARTLELLGCSIPKLRAHLEAQFRPGMTWENYGPVWHVDHRKPCISFDLSDPAQQRECFNFKNLQPLFAKENLSKNKFDRFRKRK